MRERQAITTNESPKKRETLPFRTLTNRIANAVTRIEASVLDSRIKRSSNRTRNSSTRKYSLAARDLNECNSNTPSPDMERGQNALDLRILMGESNSPTILHV
jgi:hypothetical protein